MTAHRLGYARVSTLEQALASQLDALHAPGCQKVFVDHASGTTTNRPELGRLLERIRRETPSWCGAWTASGGALREASSLINGDRCPHQLDAQHVDRRQQSSS